MRYSVGRVLLLVFLALLMVGGSSAEMGTTIQSDRLEYTPEGKTYHATGTVRIEKNGAVIEADSATYREEDSTATAEGNVRYRDRDVAAKADRAELDVEKKTGTLYHAEIFEKKNNYHLSGERIEKRGEDEYFSPDASITTCDAPLPAWCFRGKNVEAKMDEVLTARDVSFRLKGLPVLYTPYFRSSLSSERETGFLQPTVGHSKTLGVHVDLPFFWAISENRDVTFVLDVFGKRGIGTGVEYRSIGLSGQTTDLWAYGIHDTEVDKDFVEVRGAYEQRAEKSLGGFARLNYVNEKEFYQIYSFRHELNTLRFLESSAELDMRYDHARLYLLSQYRVDLKNETETAPQKMPQAGYALNYIPLGPFLLSGDITVSRFWRDTGVSATRFDFYPKLAATIGSDVTLTQIAALRETAYAFSGDTQNRSSVSREAFEYDVTGRTKFFRTYSFFTHVIEPSIRYHYVASSENNLPLFDSAEAFGRTSNIEFSLLNRAFIKGSEVAVMRLTQEYDTRKDSEAFLPTKLELGVKGAIPLLVDASYDFNKKRIETVTSALSFSMPQAMFAVGQRYSRQEDVMMLTAAASFSPTKSLQIASSVWYDAKGEGVRDFSVGLKYMAQCWGVRFDAIKRPGDTAFTVKFELAGLGSRGSHRSVFPRQSQEIFDNFFGASPAATSAP